MQKVHQYRNLISDQIKRKAKERKEIEDRELEEERTRRLAELDLQERIEREKKKGELLLQKVKELRDAMNI